MTWVKAVELLSSAGLRLLTGLMSRPVQSKMSMIYQLELVRDAGSRPRPRCSEPESASYQSSQEIHTYEMVSGTQAESSPSEIYFDMFWNRNPKDELRASSHPEGSLS